jgi:mRNA-degrading endonuclease RelE of RelBE toxin-antitoxin system
MKKLGKTLFKLRYLPPVVNRDIPRLDPPVARRIKLAIEQKLTMAPEIYGRPLHGILKAYWKFRIGDWRVAYAIISQQVIIIAIAHRSEIYALAEKRV